MANAPMILHVRSDGIVGHMDAAARRFWGADYTGTPAAHLFADTQDGWLPPSDAAEALLVDDRRRHIRFQVRPREDGLHLHVWDGETEYNARQALIASERQLKEAAEIAHIGSWMWDVADDQITWSDELYRIYGIEPAQSPASFEAYIERVHPDDRAMAIQLVQDAMRDHGHFSFDHRIVRPDEEVRWLHAQGACEIVAGNVARMYGISQDITAQQAAEAIAQERAADKVELERIQAAAEARRQMMRTMAHEMSTPLTPIRLQLQLWRQRAIQQHDPRAQRSADIIDRNIRRLASLLEDMLDVARLEGGRLEIRPTPMDLAKVVRHAAASFEAVAAEDDKHIRLHIPEHMPIEADHDRLVQVVFNLVSNAIKFSPVGSEIRIEAGVDGGAWFCVEDDGLGLDAQQLEELFRPFARMHQETGIPGNGLGLHICRGIIEEHGGQLACRSDGPGKGARFEVRLPERLLAAAPMS